MPERVKPGDPLRISAADWNAAVDAGRALQLGDGASGPNASTGRQSWTHIDLEIHAGQDLAAGHVVRVGDPVIDPNDVATARYVPPMMRGSLLRGKDLDAVAIVTRPVHDGSIARNCVTAGIAWAQVTLQTEDDTTAAPVDGETVLVGRGGGRGFPIIWKPSQVTGLQWCAIHLDRQQFGVQFAYCVLDATCHEKDQDVAIKSVRGIGWDIPESLLPDTANNIWDLRGITGQRCKILYVPGGFDPEGDEGGPEWFLDIIQGQTVDPTTGLQISELEFQRKRHPIMAMTSESESEWETWATGETCPPPNLAGDAPAAEPAWRPTGWEPPPDDLQRPPEGCGCGG